MIRRIDPIGRIAYGALCISGMSGLAVPLLLVAGPITGLVYAIEGDGLKGLTVALLAVAFAALATGLFLGIFFAAWPLASDWITEWPGYATGFGIGGTGLALMSLLVFVGPLSLYVAVIVPLAATFAVGFGIAGRLAGLSAPAAKPRVRARALRRR